MSLFFNKVHSDNNVSTTVQVTVYILNLALLFLLQYGVFNSLFAKLALEAQRTQELLRLLPGPLLESSHRLRAIVVSSKQTA